MFSKIFSKIKLNKKVMDILLFKTMLAPVVIQLVFWSLTVLTTISAIVTIFNGSILRGLWILVFGPLSIRFACEMAMLMFSINDKLAEINKNVSKGN